MLVDFDVSGQWIWIFSMDNIFFGLWTDILARSDGLKLKRLNDAFVSYKHAAFHFIRC